jgi:hypothetical protein
MARETLLSNKACIEGIKGMKAGFAPEIHNNDILYLAKDF